MILWCVDLCVMLYLYEEKKQQQPEIVEFLYYTSRDEDITVNLCRLCTAFLLKYDISKILNTRKLIFK